MKLQLGFTPSPSHPDGHVYMKDAAAILTGQNDADYFALAAWDKNAAQYVNVLRIMGGINEPYSLADQDIQLGDGKSIRTGAANDDYLSIKGWDKDGAAYAELMRVTGGINDPTLGFFGSAGQVQEAHQANPADEAALVTWAAAINAMLEGLGIMASA